MTIRRTLQLLGLTLIALTWAALAAYADAQYKAMPPLSHAGWMKLGANPRAMQNFMANLPMVPPEHAAEAPQPPVSPWVSLTNQPGTTLGNPLLLPDGTVILQHSCSSSWYKLTPDINGSYANGTWSTIASLPSGYAPRFVASAVLADGRVIVEGGEYNNVSGCNAVWTTLGAIYNPATNSWASVSPPSGWTTIGDAQAVVLNNNTFLLANCCTAQAALLNATTLAWTGTGTGKYDINDEENWSLLPNGKVLTVDAYVSTGTCGTGSEIYNPSTGVWSSAGSTLNQLSDCSGNKSYEVGPQPLRPDGTLVAFGGTTIGAAHTSIYTSSSGTWASGPDLPSISGQYYNLADAPAAVLPNGAILFAASPGLFTSPTHFFEFSTGNVISQVADATNAASFTSYQWMFLVLPTGQILVAELDGNTVQLYNPSGTYSSSWQPVISSLSSYTLAPGSTYQVSGTQLNGLSQGAYYGDDQQSSTNYPIVRITNNATGHVFFARTSGWSNSSIASGNASTANFLVAAATETGASQLVVIANGIPSAPTAVTIGSGGTYTLSVSVIGNSGGTVTSSPSGINCGSTCSHDFTAGTTVTLTATPASGWFFGVWGGACGPSSCSVTMNSPQNVLATFGPIPHAFAGKGPLLNDPSLPVIPPP